jgi:hypothetical protein
MNSEISLPNPCNIDKAVSSLMSKYEKTEKESIIHWLPHDIIQSLFFIGQTME